MSGFPQRQYFFIKSRANDVVLDVYNGGVKKDTNIIIYKKKTNNDIDNQLWFVEDGYVVNKKSGLVLDVHGGKLKSDNYIVQNERQPDSQTQRFGYREGFVYLLADPKLVVDIRGGAAKEGTKLIVYKAKTKDNANQLWILEPVAGIVQPSLGQGSVRPTTTTSTGMPSATLGNNQYNSRPTGNAGLGSNNQYDSRPSGLGNSNQYDSRPSGLGSHNQYDSRPTGHTTTTTTTTTTSGGRPTTTTTSSQYGNNSSQYGNNSSQYNSSSRPSTNSSQYGQQPSSTLNSSRPNTTSSQFGGYQEQNKFGTSPNRNEFGGQPGGYQQTQSNSYRR